MRKIDLLKDRWVCTKQMDTEELYKTIILCKFAGMRTGGSTEDLSSGTSFRYLGTGNSIGEVARWFKYDHLARHTRISYKGLLLNIKRIINEEGF